MKITYNHIIKFLLTTGIIVLIIFSELALFTQEDKTVLRTIGFIINGMAGFLLIAVIVGTIVHWAIGDFDRVLDKTVFKFPGKTSLIEELKSHLEEAQRIGDVEEIRRLKNSIEMIEKYRK